MATYNSQTKKLLYGQPLYFLKVYEKLFSGHHQSDKIWPNIVMSTYSNMVKLENRSQLTTKGRRETMSASTHLSASLLEGRPTAGPSESSEAKIRSIARSTVMRREAIAKILQTSHFDGIQLKNFQCKVWSKVVSIDADMQDGCKELKARCPTIGGFKVWLTKVMARIGGHTRSYVR